jgi:hypothetical protein
MNKQILMSCFPVVAVTVLFTACSHDISNPTSTAEVLPKEATAPPEPVAAQSAFFEMYKPVRNWAPDVYPLSLASGEVPGVTNQGGKAGLWTAVFVSPSRHEARTLVYSVIDSGSNTRKGVNMGGAQSWSGPTPKAKPFQVSEFVINSDAAYKTAMEKAGPWVQKHPNKSLSMFLASAQRQQGPVWYFLWGDTKSGYLAHINATTGMATTIK